MTEQTDAKVRMHAADLEAAGNLAEARQARPMRCTTLSPPSLAAERGFAAGSVTPIGLADLALLLGDAESALTSAETAKAQAMQLQGGKPVSYRTGLASLTRARALAAAGRTTEARAEAAAAEAMLVAVDSDHPALQQARAIAGR